jgi:hypothetical protein
MLAPRLLLLVLSSVATTLLLTSVTMRAGRTKCTTGLVRLRTMCEREQTFGTEMPQACECAKALDVEGFKRGPVRNHVKISSKGQLAQRTLPLRNVLCTTFENRTEIGPNGTRLPAVGTLPFWDRMRCQHRPFARRQSGCRTELSSGPDPAPRMLLRRRDTCLPRHRSQGCGRDGIEVTSCSTPS